jgi:cytidine deaminase
MKLDIEEQKELIKKSLEMRNFSYTPYSHWNVGAALLTEDGKVYTGCNIENAGYTATNCAERTAIFKAVSEGELKFKAIAISGGPAGQDPTSYCPPCGVCRQVMREFCKDDFPIYVAKSVDDYQTFTLGELFPASFGPEDLGK